MTAPPSPDASPSLLLLSYFSVALTYTRENTVNLDRSRIPEIQRSRGTSYGTPDINQTRRALYYTEPRDQRERLRDMTASGSDSLDIRKLE